MHSFHLLSVPLVYLKTAEIIFSAGSKLLDLNSPKWKTELVSVSTDGQRTMAGILPELATRIQQVLEDGVVRV